VALNDEVQRPEYTKALQEPDAHTKKQPELQTRLKAFKASLGGHEEAVTHCVLFDAKGFLVSVYPHEEGLIQSFAWRGYFNGGIDDWKAKRTDGGLPLDANKQAYKPIRSMHLSHPFASVGREGKLAVGLSTPVLNGQEEVMGVMLVMLNLHDLHSWLMEIEIPGGFPVLVDDEYHVLLHESAKDNLPELGANPKTYRDSNLYRAVFDKAKTRPATGGADDFTDPVDKEKYLVGYVPIEFKDPTAKVNLRKRWGVLVQVNHAKVIEPAVTLKNEMVHWGGMMLGVALLLVLALWLGLVWLLRREERLAHG
jgi:hypothetical protein